MGQAARAAPSIQFFHSQNGLLAINLCALNDL
jgi:hypothetical protein